MFNLIFENLILNNFCHNYDNYSMFRDVPECSMFLVLSTTKVQTNENLILRLTHLYLLYYISFYLKLDHWIIQLESFHWLSHHALWLKTALRFQRSRATAVNISRVNSELLPVWRHSFGNVARSWHLAGNSFIVRCHVTMN